MDGNFLKKIGRGRQKGEASLQHPSQKVRFRNKVDRVEIFSILGTTLGWFVRSMGLDMDYPT
jgi:hypothetical protein